MATDLISLPPLTREQFLALSDALTQYVDGADGCDADPETAEPVRQVLDLCEAMLSAEAHAMICEVCEDAPATTCGDPRLVGCIVTLSMCGDCAATDPRMR